MKEFKLSDSFLEQYKSVRPNWGPLGEFTFLRTYSRFIEEEERNEAWWETVRRVVEGTFSIQKQHVHGLRLPWSNAKAQRSAQKMYEKIFNFKFLPPGRGLWMMGTDFVKTRGGMALNNCAFASTEDIDTKGSLAFVWSMDALMLGVGVGFDTRGAGKIEIKQPKPDGIYQIPDSREGWVESLRLLIDAFFLGRPIPEFDYSLIRGKGELIRGFGGVSAGPEPLRLLHERVRSLLQGRIGRKLRSTDIVDIMNFIGVCVVAGNVRRSAECAIGDATDLSFVEMKNPDKHTDELISHRWASNNSVFLSVGDDYSDVANMIAKNGEPGCVWLDNCKAYGRTKDGQNYKDSAAAGLNPCFEQVLHSFEMCCLVETFPSLHDSYEEFEETLKYAYLYAKTVTLVPTHWEETNAVMMRNRRIGASQSGIIDAFAKHGRRNMLKWSDDGYEYLQQLDKIYSDWLCVPRSIKTTSVKPSGTVSLLAGVSPGIHYPHSEYYIRRIRIAANSSLVKPIIDAGYHVEPSAYGKTEDERNETLVISFPVKQENFTKSKFDATLWEQMKNVVDYQNFWSDNSVSATVTFKENERNDLVSVLESYEDVLKAISFLPLETNGYAQLPYEEITKEEYEKMVSSVTLPDFSGVTQSPMGSKFCDSDYCEI